MSKTFSCTHTVRFGECDPAGVVYYPVFFNWFHELMEQWFEEELGQSYAECIRHVGFPAKETHAEFFRPCVLGEELRLVMHLSHLSRRSFRMEIEIIGTAKTKARGHVVCVCIGVQKEGFRFTPQEIPSSLHEKMEKFLLID